MNLNCLSLHDFRQYLTHQANVSENGFCVRRIPSNCLRHPVFTMLSLNERKQFVTGNDAVHWAFVLTSN